MRLFSIRLTNFKGIRALAIDADGRNLDIFGTNATGKTTIFDAFTWLLFDKDSQGKKDFSIKTLDENNQPIHGLEHEVEGIFDLGGKIIALRKVYSEKWTKQRGSAQATMTGHTTDYFLDGVPVQLKEYQNRIAAIADESIFRLLTNPAYFNEQLHWQRRREILLQVCGDIADDDVIASDRSLAKLPDILNGRSLDDHRKVIAAQKLKINEELQKIPVRIDEANRSLPDISAINIGAQEVADIKNRLRQNREELVRIESGGQIAELKKQLAQAQTEQINRENEARAAANKVNQEKRRKLSEIKDATSDTERIIKGLEFTIGSNNNEISRLNTRLENLRQAWFDVDALQFIFEQSDTCPTCRRALPEEQLMAARGKAQTDFNLKKAKDLEQIGGEGQKLKSAIEELQAANNDLQKRLDEATTKMCELNNTGCKAIDDIEAQQAEAVISINPDIERLKAEIEQLQAGNIKATDEAKRRIQESEQALQECEKQLAQVVQYKQGQNRIRELADEEKKQAAEYEKLEGELYLCECFIKTKVAMLDEKINSRFKLARFKLFDVQVNGGIAECCITTLGGVPYDSGLNNAGKINVGIDIINTLAEHYGFNAPIFIDNAEAVTELIPAQGQMIRLIVSPEDKKLRVEAL